jgi:hypothetical protein
MARDITDEILCVLFDEEYIKRAAEFFEYTLHGLGKDDEFRIDILYSYSYVTESAYYVVSVPGLCLPENIAVMLDKRFDTKLEAVKNLALCACMFAQQHAEKELATPPDEQGWMPESMAYWHRLREEVSTYKNQYLSDLK